MSGLKIGRSCSTGRVPPRCPRTVINRRWSIPRRSVAVCGSSLACGSSGTLARNVVAFERAVIRLPEVIHTHHITGNYDYLLHVEVADLPAYEDFHTNRLATLPSVAAVTSYVTMKTLSPVQTDA